MQGTQTIRHIYAKSLDIADIVLNAFFLSRFVCLKIVAKQSWG